MKRMTFLMFLLTAMAALSDLPGFLTQEKRDWKFIQSVGGMKVSAHGKQLIVNCDVSGVNKITVKPTLVNSALGVRKINVKREGNKLFLTVVTSVISKEAGPVPKPMDLSSHPDGDYEVIYLDPKGGKTVIGKVTLQAGVKGEK